MRYIRKRQVSKLKSCDAPIHVGSAFELYLGLRSGESKENTGNRCIAYEHSFTIDLDTIPKWAGDDKERLLIEMDE